ncbi:MAG: HAD family phosphatase [Bacteriovoracaceae bacterium]|nr:HAD family phosphatase [Bacteriovoracaceae bacterium]
MAQTPWQKLVLAKKGFFFDLDGTLLNSEPLHATAIFKILQAVGLGQDYSPALLEKKYMGCTDDYIFQEEGLAARLSLAEFYAQKAVLMQEILAALTKEDEQRLLAPGIIEFLAWAQAAGKCLAIVSASERYFIDLVLAQFKMQDFFAYIIAHEDCATAKPAPGPYLTALERGGLAAQEALAFEDSPPGQRAAQAAFIEVIPVALSPRPNALTDFKILLPA